MRLANFGAVYDCYRQLIERDSKYIPTCVDDFEWQPRRLLEAYALAERAIEDKSVLHTAPWERQSGATTTALALMLTTSNVVILKADMRGAKHISNIMMRTFSGQSLNALERVKPNVVHKSVWWVTGLYECMMGQHPDLVIVDSETAWRRERDQAISTVSMLNCGVLVLDGPSGIDFVI